MKTQWPRSADEPGLYMAQTGNRAASLHCGGARLCGVCWHVCLACARLCLCPEAQSRLCHGKPTGRAGQPPEERVTWGQSRKVPPTPAHLAGSSSRSRDVPAADAVPLS